MAANSELLRASLGYFDEEDYATILLPDISVATVSSMLKCTLNPAVRNDTLSVNEVQVMKLLGFPVSTSQTEYASKLNAECDKRSVLELQLSSCMQDGYVSGDLDVSIGPDVSSHTENSILENDNEDDEDNLDNISLLSSTLSIGDVSRVIGLKNPETIGTDKKDSILIESPSKCMVENNVLPLPLHSDDQTTKEQIVPPQESSVLNIELQEKQIEITVKSSLEKYFDRESVINTPTLPNLTGDEQDELENMSDFPLTSEESIILKKHNPFLEPEKVFPSEGIMPSDELPNIISNKNLIPDDLDRNIKLELESSSSNHQREGWTICEEPSSCDIGLSHSEVSKSPEKSIRFSLKPPKAKLFACPSPNCKLRFQRRLHYDRHVGRCLSQSVNAEDEESSRGDFECEECGKSFHHPDNLKLHEKYHADLLVEKQCTICGTSGIMGRHALTAHMEKFHATKIPCPFCEKILSSRRLLNRHISRIHQNKAGKYCAIE